MLAEQAWNWGRVCCCLPFSLTHLIPSVLPGLQSRNPCLHLKFLSPEGWSSSVGSGLDVGEREQSTPYLPAADYSFITHQAQVRLKGAGLGAKGSAYGLSGADSYKDAVRKAMFARFTEME